MTTLQYNPQSGRRGIEWCDATMNPIGGCEHACRWEMPNGTIAKCYAEELAENGVAQAGYPQGFAHHYWRANGLKEMKKAGPPQLVFIDSMSDMFGHWVPEEQIDQVLAAMAEGGHNTFQALTKNPRRYLKVLDRLPGNLWCGASSAPDFFMGKRLTPAQQERYMTVALETLAAVRRQTGNVVWMSVEPLSWDVADLLAAHPALDWVIIGAASNGPRYFQPDPQHVDRLLDVLDAQGVAVFYKGNIKKTFELYDFGTDAKNRWREDFPARPIPARPGHDAVPGPAPAVARRQRRAASLGWTLNTFLPAEPEAEPVLPAAAPQQLALL